MQTDKKKMSTSVFESITRCRTLKNKKIYITEQKCGDRALA